MGTNPNEHVVTFTAKNDGTTGNKIDLRVNYNYGEELPAGTACTIAAMASGATDGAVASAITAMGAVHYHTVISAWDDDTNLDLFEAAMTTRWGPTVKQYGHLFAATMGSQGTMTTAGNLRNKYFTSVMGSGLSPAPTYWWAASAGALDAYECGVDPSRPRNTLELVGCLAPAPASCLTATERNPLLTNGISTYTVDSDRTCRIERLITTLQTTNSVPDDSWLDITKPRTLAAMAYSIEVRFALRFPRYKLADDGANYDPGQPVMTPGLAKSELLTLYKLWLGVAWVEDKMTQFKTDMLVERNSSNRNRLDVRIAPDLIDSFDILACQIQFQ